MNASEARKIAEQNPNGNNWIEAISKEIERCAKEGLCEAVVLIPKEVNKNVVCKYLNENGFVILCNELIEHFRITISW